jgi:hypothetical protein
MKKHYTMRAALDNPELFGSIMSGKSWSRWRTLLIASMGEPLTFWERRIFRKFTGRDREPGQMVEELVAVAGRRSGKSRSAAVLAAYMAALCDHSDAQAVGERLKVLVLAKDQRQAGVVFGYISGVFDSVPLLREMVVNRTLDTISLSTGIDVEIKAATPTGVRGFTAVCVIADEAAFWTTDTASANADTEILNAVRPSLITTQGPLLILSSPFARRGEVWELYDKHYGAKGDPGILVLHGASRVFNPSLPNSVVERALARNPIAARAEYLAEFRSDLEGYVSLDTLRACTGPVTEWPPLPGVHYTAGIDAATGSGDDSLALGIAHFDEGSGRVILDFIREWRPPFSPTAVLTEVASHCRRFNIAEIIGDRFAEKFVAEMLFGSRMHYRRSDRVTSDNFAELLPMLNSHEVMLPNLPAFIEQLASLQAKPSSRGRVSWWRQQCTRRHGRGRSYRHHALQSGGQGSRRLDVLDSPRRRYWQRHRLALRHDRGDRFSEKRIFRLTNEG